MKREKVENHSGVKLNIESLFPTMKNRDWEELDITVGGDAPKNFLAIYEYSQRSGIRRVNTHTWPRYIAKVGHKWYPIESINEYLFNQLGEVLGLDMARSRLVVIYGQLRFLSRYFLSRDESLVHGAEIFAGYISDKDFVEMVEQEGLAREFFTFGFAKDAIEHMFPATAQQILKSFVKMLTYDALIGNNDRHFYNWGVVKDIKGRRKPQFSPVYDSARGLFWNMPESKINKWFSEPKQLGTRIKKYAEGSRPKIGWDGKDLNHFDLMEKIYKSEGRYKKVIASFFDNTSLAGMLEFLDDNFNSYFSTRRMALIKKCLEYRFDRLSNIVQ